MERRHFRYVQNIDRDALDWVKELAKLDIVPLVIIGLIIAVVFVTPIFLLWARINDKRENRETVAQAFYQTLVTKMTESQSTLATAFKEISTAINNQTPPMVTQAEKLTAIAAGTDKQNTYLATVANESQKTAERVQELHKFQIDHANDQIDGLSTHADIIVTAIHEVPALTADKIIPAVKDAIEAARQSLEQVTVELSSDVAELEKATRMDYENIVADRNRYQTAWQIAAKQNESLRTQLAKAGIAVSLVPDPLAPVTEASSESKAVTS